jgi:hypothetical protein
LTETKGALHLDLGIPVMQHPPELCHTLALVGGL